MDFPCTGIFFNGMYTIVNGCTMISVFIGLFHSIYLYNNDVNVKTHFYDCNWLRIV